MRIRVRAEFRPHGALLDDREVDRQRARAQRNGQLVRLLDGEPARDDGVAAEDRLIDVRCGKNLAVEDDGEGLVDVLARQPGELGAALLVEGYGDGRLVGLRREALLRVGQLIAANAAEPLHRDGLAGERRGRVIRQDLAAGRRDALRDVGLQRCHVDQLEFQLGGLADQRLERLGVLLSRRLDRDAVITVAQDGRLKRADGVDAPVDHFLGAVHRLVDGEFKPSLGGREDEAIAVHHLQVPIAHRAGSVDRRQDRLPCRVEPARVVEHERQAPAGRRNVADADARFGLAHRGAHGLFHRLQPLPRDLLRIGLEQDAAAAGKVEAEVDLRIGQRRGPGAAALHHERGDGRKRRDQRQRPEPYALPAGKIEHGCLSSCRAQSLAGVPPAGTMSPIVDLTTLTRTPCAISISA